MPDFSEPTVTVAEFAAMHKLCRHTIYRLVRDGEVPSYRLGKSIRIPVGARLASESAR